jgi:hypothetical protein
MIKAGLLGQFWLVESLQEDLDPGPPNTNIGQRRGVDGCD